MEVNDNKKFKKSSMEIQCLRQMIDDVLVYRNDYHENPPKVYYGLTDLGKEMMPIIDALADFGNYYKTIVD